MPVDFVIVGAGIAGATLAARLAAHGSVQLLEREAQPGQHSTGRSAAMFMESYGPPQARALTRCSRAAYAPTVLTPRGVLYAAWRGQEALLEQQLATLQATGAAVQRIDASEALALVPVLQPAGLIGAIAETGAMDIDVHALHQQALRQARGLGAALWTDAELESARLDAHGWTLAVAGGRTMQARVLAARVVGARLAGIGGAQDRNPISPGRPLNGIRWAEQHHARDPQGGGQMGDPRIIACEAAAHRE